MNKVFGCLILVAVAIGMLPEAKAGTALSDAAAAMSPGEWAPFATDGIGVALDDNVAGGVGSILPYADKLHWDPVTNRVYLANSDDPGDGRRFVAYDEMTNAWVVLSDPWTSSGVAHQYGLADIDVDGRRIYFVMPDGDYGSYYDIAMQEFVDMEFGGWAYSCCGAVAYFPERSSLIYAHGSSLRERSDATGQWTTLSSIDTSYHSIAYYNPIHKLVVFGGGNESGRSFYKLEPNGQVITLGQPPIDLRSSRLEFVVNPVTGNFLVLGLGERLYTYNPVSDNWTAESTNAVPAEIWTGTSNEFLTVATTIPHYGISFFVSCRVGGGCSVNLYKHANPPSAPVGTTDLVAE